MKLSIAHRTLIASALVAALGMSTAPSFAQAGGNSNGPGSPGMQQPPGSEGANGSAGASTNPSGMAASPSMDDASGSGATQMKHKHKKHHHRHHRGMSGASNPEAASSTKP